MTKPLIGETITAFANCARRIDPMSAAKASYGDRADSYILASDARAVGQHVVEVSDCNLAVRTQAIVRRPKGTSEERREAAVWVKITLAKETMPKNLVTNRFTKRGIANCLLTLSATDVSAVGWQIIERTDLSNVNIDLYADLRHIRDQDRSPICPAPPRAVTGIRI